MQPLGAGRDDQYVLRQQRTGGIRGMGRQIGDRAVAVGPHTAFDVARDQVAILVEELELADQAAGTFTTARIDGIDAEAAALAGIHGEVMTARRGGPGDAG